MIKKLNDQKVLFQTSQFSVSFASIEFTCQTVLFDPHK